jgi:hypothetical protein
VTIDLNTKFPKGGGGPYIVTISGEDTCQHSATVTLTIGTYNAVSHIKCIVVSHTFLMAHRGRDRMIVVSSNPSHDKVYSKQHYVIKLVSDLQQVGGFLRVIHLT